VRIEPLFAEGKLWHGMRRFRTRTLKKVNTEALMTATGQNIKRLLRFREGVPKKLAQAEALQLPARLRPDDAHRRSGDHHRKRRVNASFFNKLERLGDERHSEEGFHRGVSQRPHQPDYLPRQPADDLNLPASPFSLVDAQDTCGLCWKECE
jgi:hypothetical protein